MKKLKYKIIARVVKFSLFKRYELKAKLYNSHNIIVGKNFKFGDGLFLSLTDISSQLKIDENVSSRANLSILIYSNGYIHIGSNVFFNNNCSINSLELIEIGENTIFGESVKIYDHNHKYSFDESGRLEIKRGEFKTAPIKIGKNCWIGSNVTILKGVEIGDNSIIGAHCLIRESVPANSIVKQKSELIIESR